jgi:epoxyqueuosine reductase QueG
MDMTKCLSSITQKRGNLTDDEINEIKKYSCAWGCDICQNVCPHTQKAAQNGTIYTEVDFFKTQRTSYLTSNMIEEMNNEEFSERAYSWRGKKVILRNLTLLEGGEK